MKIVDDLFGHKCDMPSTWAPNLKNALPAASILYSDLCRVDTNQETDLSQAMPIPPFKHMVLAAKVECDVEIAVFMKTFDLGGGTYASGYVSECGFACGDAKEFLSVQGIVFVRHPNGGLTFCAGAIEWMVDGTGHLCNRIRPTDGDGSASDSVRAIKMSICNSLLSDKQNAEILVTMATRLTVFALTMCHCKNVSISEQPCSPKLAKRYQERHGHKRPRYYVLDIEPMRKIFRDANGGKDGISLSKALHICRGHFKDYREKPLFGKTKGLFWWQPHVRGNAEAGVVDKDYRIKLP